MNQDELHSSGEEPSLSPDFAARVLHQADLRIRRRRRIRRAVAGAAAVSAVAVAIIFGARDLPVPGYRATPLPSGNLSAGDPADILSDNDRRDVLDYMFPDAAPLARFDARYSETSSGGDDLFAQDAGQTDEFL